MNSCLTQSVVYHVLLHKEIKFEQVVIFPGALHRGLEAFVVCPPTCRILHEILCVLFSRY